MRFVQFLFFRHALEKSPSPYGEGPNFQPDHLYTTYRSVVNLLFRDHGNFFPLISSIVNCHYCHGDFLVKAPWAAASRI